MWKGDNLWEDEKVFFRPGDIVKLKHSDIDNRPNMLVIGKEILTETRWQKRKNFSSRNEMYVV